jgi:hypothetical protein
MIKILIRLWNYIRVKNAIAYANKMHAQTNKQYFVIQIGHHIRVLTRAQINYLVDIHILHRCMKEFYNIIKYSIYYTR